MEPSKTQDQREGQEPDGRTWSREMQCNLLGMRRWRRRARNGDEWRHALREARARKGL